MLRDLFANLPFLPSLPCGGGFTFFFPVFMARVKQRQPPRKKQVVEVATGDEATGQLDNWSLAFVDEDELLVREFDGVAFLQVATAPVRCAGEGLSVVYAIEHPDADEEDSDYKDEFLEATEKTPEAHEVAGLEALHSALNRVGLNLERENHARQLVKRARETCKGIGYHIARCEHLPLQAFVLNSGSLVASLRASKPEDRPTVHELHRLVEARVSKDVAFVKKHFA